MAVLALCALGSHTVSSGNVTSLTLETTVSEGQLDLMVNETTNASFVLQENSLGQNADIKSSAQGLNVVLDFYTTDQGVISPVKNIVIVNASIPLTVTIPIHTVQKGKTKLLVNGTSQLKISTTKATLTIGVYDSDVAKVASDVVGWIYFAAWTVSFYPQIYDNWRRKCVVGLNFDFLALNIVGFTLYSFYNVGVYWVTAIQDQYMTKHQTQVIPVKINDVFFGLNAILACIITIVQCFIYERGSQTISKTCRILLVLMGLFFVAIMISSFAQALSWLDFLTYASYIKLFITLIKYIPQAYMNFVRKSTDGWSIGNVLLDFAGGIFSILQMILDAYNYGDWTSFVGDFTKLGLGMFSVAFDILFMFQHYVCFRKTRQSLLETDDENSLVDDEDVIVQPVSPRLNYGTANNAFESDRAVET